MKIASRTLLTACLVALTCALAVQPADAQNNKPNIGAVQVVVRDIQTKEDIGTVEPGGSITLPAGVRVRLIMSALPTGSARGPLYPATTFSDSNPGRGGVRITRSNAENSTADLELVANKNTARTETVRYQITDAWVPANLRTGSFTIRVEPGASVGAVSQGIGTGAAWTNDRARDLTRALYQGILMRDLDAGAQGSIDAIRNGGYDALVNAAVSIANSNESRVTIATRGVTAEQRLETLYRNLLGVAPDQVDRAQWDADLRRLNDGHIADVVQSIVSSERFRTRYNLGVRY
jgi:hypothetical protein